MKRRTFIKNSSLATFAVATPSLFISNNLAVQEYSDLELTGKITPKLYGEGNHLRKEAYEAFLEMQQAAKADGVNINIASGYRSFERQKNIWEQKYLSYTQEGLEPKAALQKIIEYSTIPGTSRHHWGTDIDVFDAYTKHSGKILITENYTEKGRYSALREWMEAYADIYGFHLVYTDNPNRKGFKYEPWHYSYAPLSKPMLKQFRKINIMKFLKHENFIGSEHFSTGFIKTYIKENILDINPYLL